MEVAPTVGENLPDIHKETKCGGGVIFIGSSQEKGEPTPIFLVTEWVTNGLGRTIGDE
jgi:hypothetical protein